MYNPLRRIGLARIQIHFSQILKIIAFYELEELEELEKNIRLTERYYKNDVRLPLQSLEWITLRAVKQMGKVTPREQIKIIKELKVTLNEIPLSRKKRLGFDEIQLWVNSRIEQKTILELLQERNKKRGSTN